MKFNVTARIQSKMSPQDPVDMRWATESSEAGAIAAVAGLMSQSDTFTALLSIKIDIVPEVGEQPPWQTS